MEERTTIQLPKPVVARLRKAKSAGQTYAEVIDEALKALRDRRLFIKEQLRRAEAVLAEEAPYRVL